MAFARDFLISAFAVPIFREGFEATGHWVHWVGRESSFITRKPNFLLPTNTIYHSTLMYFVDFLSCLVLHTVTRILVKYDLFADWKTHKGQLISEWIYEVIISPKIRTKIVKISALTTQGRNPHNFLFLFWVKRLLHKFILKLTDL